MQCFVNLFENDYQSFILNNKLITIININISKVNVSYISIININIKEIK